MQLWSKIAIDKKLVYSNQVNKLFQFLKLGEKYIYTKNGNLVLF